MNKKLYNAVSLSKQKILEVKEKYRLKASQKCYYCNREMYQDSQSNAGGRRANQQFDETSLDRDLSALSDFGGISESGMSTNDIKSAQSPTVENKMVRSAKNL